MARPKQMSDEELLQIALECFLEHGSNVSAQAIADKVGISQPALFKRFGSKEELFLQAVLPPEQYPVIDWIDAGPTSSPLSAQLGELLEKVQEMLDSVMPRVQLLREARIPAGTAMSRYKTAPPVQLIQSITAFIERAQQRSLVRSSVNPGFAAQWIFGALMGQYALNQSIDQKHQSENNTLFIESTVDFLIHGIKPQEAVLDE